MTYYKICPSCGGHLDPGERCECENEKVKMKERWEYLTTEGNFGQIKLKLQERNQTSESNENKNQEFIRN